MADHSSILARKIPRREARASYSPRGSRESDMTAVTERTCTNALKGTNLNWIVMDFSQTHTDLRPHPHQAIDLPQGDSLRPLPS